MNHNDELQAAIADILQNEYNIISFSHLQPNESYKNKCIVGKIEFLSAIKTRQKNGHMRKCLLSDATTTDTSVEKLSVFLFDELAVGSSCAEVEGFLMITDFQVENLTLNCQRIKGMCLLPIQILVKGASEFWVFQKKTAADFLTDVSIENSQSDRDVSISDYSQSVLPDVQSIIQPAAPPPQVAVPISPSKPYTYVSLCELIETDRKTYFNIYGVVEDCQLKTNQKPHASVLTVLLSDATKKDFSVSVFVLADESFPDVRPGDIMRIHRMNVENFRGTLKGKCMMARFILVFSKEDKGAMPKSVAKTYTLTDGDRIEVDNLFTWVEKRYWKVIADMKIGDFVNVLCQVISVYFPKSSDSVLLTIWDGTQNTDIEVEHRDGLMQKEDRDLMKIAKDYAIKLWVNGNHTLAAGELEPHQFIEVLDAEVICPKNAPSSKHASLALKSSYKSNRGIKVVADEKRLEELKLRLDTVFSDASLNDSRESETIENIVSFINSGLLPSTSSHQSNLEEASTSARASSGHGKISSNKKLPLKKTVNITDVPSRQIVINEPSHRTSVPERDEMSTTMARVEVTGRKEPVFIPTMSSAVNSRIEIQRQTTHSNLPPTNRTQPSRPLVGSTNANPVMSSQQITQLSLPYPILTQEKRLPLLSRTSNSQAILSASVQAGQSTQTFGYYDGNTAELLEESPELRLSQFPASCDGTQGQKNTQESSLKGAISSTKKHAQISYATILDVVNHRVPYKFRVLTNVLGIQPHVDSINKLIRLYCPSCHYLSEDSDPNLDEIGWENGVKVYHCPFCDSQLGKSTTLEYTYLLSFSLQDGTQAGAIDVYIWRENAINLFKGITAEKALSDEAASRRIFEMLWNICPNAHPGGTEADSFAENARWSSYPTLDCCITSYTAGGVTRYQMFDTVIL